jgi:hypothetical protein
MKDAIDGYEKHKSDVRTLGLLFLLVFPKTLMIFLFFIGYMVYAS